MRDLANPALARHHDTARGTIMLSPGTRGGEYTWRWTDGRKLSFNAQG